MNLYTKRLDYFFGIAFFLMVSSSVLWPGFHIQYLIPFLILAIYKRSFFHCLWFALCCGFLLDLFSPNLRLGTYACCYTLAMVIVYKQKRHFFADTLSTMPIMVFLFSSLSSLFLIPFEGISFSWSLIITDLIIYPILDATYGFSIYVLPFWIFGKRQLKGEDYFMEQ